MHVAEFFYYFFCFISTFERFVEFYIPKMEAFALSGRIIMGPQAPGRCPGLGASAPSGRVGAQLT